MAHTVALVSLGCAKNQVNSEQMLWKLEKEGYALTGDAAQADTVIINTCAFIDSAKEEAIDAILEYSALGGKKVIVAGCLAQRYREEILAELPEVDNLVGCGSFDDICRAVEMAWEGNREGVFGDIDAPVSESGRITDCSRGWAYLRIAEGCSNRCAYCIIPKLRGKYRSRPMENVLREARSLADQGAKELIVVAQDITRYGTDLYGRPSLSRLIRLLAKTEGTEWIRLHYLYPDMIDDELIRTVAEEPKVVKYLDIPIQHINDGILRAMNRRGSAEEIERLIEKLRKEIPGVVIRTSLITGLPGEGEKEFEELCNFLKRTRLERAGVFAFSPQEGTPAYDMDRPASETAQRRAELLADIQSRIMDEFNESRVGGEAKVLAEEYDAENGCWYGRSEADSPDVDGRVAFTGDGVAAGEFYTVRITGTVGGDLTGELI
ncbi:MAG: 30S ribosomal protein S12 methylthiotransferase RimO [Oscillospiraceae bacterium]|nr:30S ribosomal protein S12 methylthiotransferase RimO [Oscillospiraceae bacterium]